MPEFLKAAAFPAKATINVQLHAAGMLGRIKIVQADDTRSLGDEVAGKRDC
eukprot:gene52009-55526_t